MNNMPSRFTVTLQCGAKAIFEYHQAFMEECGFPYLGFIEGVEGFQSWKANGLFREDDKPHGFDMKTNTVAAI